MSHETTKHPKPSLRSGFGSFVVSCSTICQYSCNSGYTTSVDCVLMDPSTNTGKQPPLLIHPAHKAKQAAWGEAAPARMCHGKSRQLLNINIFQLKKYLHRYIPKWKALPNNPLKNFYKNFSRKCRQKISRILSRGWLKTNRKRGLSARFFKTFWMNQFLKE